MAIKDSVGRTGLDRPTRVLLLAALALAIIHHIDHVLRVDHSGWPFLPRITPFTFSLLAYPMVLFAWLGPQRLYWLRWALLAAGTAFTLYAHTVIESPSMQYGMWARGHSIDPHAHGVANLPGLRSPLLGAVSVTAAMALNLVALAATLTMLARGLRMQRA